MENPVPRKLRAAVAQLGPIHLADSREAVVKRLIALLREAHGTGAKFVVFPELALTTFFPCYWMTEQAEIDRYFERDMPGPETRPLFDLAYRPLPQDPPARPFRASAAGAVPAPRKTLLRCRQ